MVLRAMEVLLTVMMKVPITAKADATHKESDLLPAAVLQSSLLPHKVSPSRRLSIYTVKGRYSTEHWDCIDLAWNGTIMRFHCIFILYKPLDRRSFGQSILVSSASGKQDQSFVTVRE
jgi:hypothetical protein